MKYLGHESSTLEFKREIPTKQELAKSIIGFCNLYGGRVVIDVNDWGEIVGIPEKEIDRLIEKLQQSILDSCTPTIIADIHIQRIEDKLLLIVKVSEGMNKPYFLTEKGLDASTYVRMGRQTMKASTEIIHVLQWQSKGKSPDMKPIYHASLNDLDLLIVDTFFRNRVQKPDDESPGISLEELMFHYKILVKEYGRTYPSLGGLLLFGKRPQDYLGEVFIICSHFKGISGRDTVATRDCAKTLFTQYEECLAFVVSRLNRQFTIREGSRRDESLELLEEALREVILNAIVHRNYFIPGPTKVAIFDDRIEIFSPGTFPGPLNSSNLEMGLTYIRNYVISRIFREAGYIEKLEPGFLTLFKTYREQNLPLPVVQEGAGFVKCILLRRGLGAVKSSQATPEHELFKLFLIADEIKPSDVIRHFSISRATASRMLSKLVQQGLIVKIGKAGATHYKRKLAILF
jgi:ATP-dependent DNA helicase RecG